MRSREAERDDFFAHVDYQTHVLDITWSFWIRFWGRGRERRLREIGKTNRNEIAPEV